MAPSPAMVVAATPAASLKAVAKTAKRSDEAGGLVFALNGEKVELQNVDPSMTLNEYLRLNTPYRGTKLACGEGGCGACAVILSRHDPATGCVKEFSANSCLTALGSVHGHSVLTSEGLGNSTSGFHTVQKRLAGFHASQCGYCTPGMAVSIYSKLRQKAAGKGGGCQQNGRAGGGLSAEEAESALQGNICRCTGYRPLLDVCKSFASGMDMEDLGLCTFQAEKQAPPYNPAEDPQFPPFLMPEDSEGGPLSKLRVAWGEGQEWQAAESLQELLQLLDRCQGRHVKLVAGNTSRGYFKEDHPQVYIDVRGVPELTAVKMTPEGLVIGGAVTLADLISALETNPELKGSPVYPQLAVHLRRVAGNHVRNVASLAGNLVLAQRGFPSDVATLLLGAGATLSVAEQGSAPSSISMDEFLDAKLPPTAVLVSVVIPPSQAGGLFHSYRAAPRPAGNALAYCNAAFKVDSVSSGGVLEGVVLAFGAFGGRRAVRARGAEKVLEGATLTPTLLLKAAEAVKSDIVPPKGVQCKEYRQTLPVSFLYEFFAPLLQGGAGGDVPVWKGVGVSSGQQTFSFTKEHFPVSEPVKKLGAELQASGEAVYVDDIPLPEGLLYAAYVTSAHARAKVLSIDPSKALKDAGVKAFFDAQAIPGENVGMAFMMIKEPLFPREEAEYMGHPLGLVVADSPARAAKAAAKVKVEYEVQKAVLSVEEAEAAGWQASWAPFVQGLIPKRGDFEAAWAEAEERIEGGEVFMGSQQHFFMENNVAMAVPDEGGALTVYTSSQGPELLQATVAKMLGVPYNSVRAVTRRLGGGFGGKATRCIPVAAAVSLAAHKLGRPVKMSLSRNQDMALTGGRCPTKASYDVGFKKDGTITAVRLRVAMIQGWTKDLADVDAFGFCKGFEQYNFRNFATDLRLYKANLSAKTSVRAPGEPQAVFVSETIIEHVAAATGLSPDAVRAKNMFSREELQAIAPNTKMRGEDGFTLPRVWAGLRESAQFGQRAAEVEQFNSEHRWRKRGLSMTPVTYSVMVGGKNARVSVFADGSVVVDVGGVEMGQGLLTKVLQTASYTLSRPFGGVEKGGVSMDRIRIVDQDTLSLPNGGVTAGSTGSEASCEAVRRACEILNERFAAVLEGQRKKKAEEGKGEGVTWAQLVPALKGGGVDLSAGTAYFSDTPDGSEKKLAYFNFGAAISEVEVDVLTGAVSVEWCDILYDCGKSLNPAVDIGQVEGAFVQGLGYFLWEEVSVDAAGAPLYNSTWTYKVPTFDTVPRRLNVDLLSSAPNEKGILSSKASGEPPLLGAVSAHCAVRHAISAARRDLLGDKAEPFFRLDVPATMDKVKLACGADVVEAHLRKLAA